jgi:hypothetical protein
MKECKGIMEMGGQEKYFKATIGTMALTRSIFLSVGERLHSVLLIQPWVKTSGQVALFLFCSVPPFLGPHFG